jgi:CBS domain containing-hemolysin-like protein
MSLPIAANLPSSMFTPIAVLLAAYVVVSILAGRARSHEDRPRAERFSTIAFGLVLVSAAYAVVLLISAVVSYPSRFSDMVVIIIVIGVFFVLLLFAFFVIAELIPRALRRGRD